MKKNELKIKQELSTEEAINLLNEVSKSLSEGTLCIEYGEKKVVLKPGCRIETKIEASTKKGKQGLIIDFSWKEEDPLCACTPSLKISSKEPEEDVLEEGLSDTVDSEDEIKEGEEKNLDGDSDEGEEKKTTSKEFEENETQSPESYSIDNFKESKPSEETEEEK